MNDHQKRKMRGQGMVEFALSLPLLLVLLLGVIEAGRLLFIYSAVMTSSREAARYGSASGSAGGGIVNYQNCDGIREAAKRLGFMAGIENDHIKIAYDQGPGSVSYATCETVFTITNPSVSDRVHLGDRVVVKVRVPYQPIVPLVNFFGFNIGSESSRTLVKDVPYKIEFED
jgi:Flp pilus assembly protein TadG